MSWTNWLKVTLDPEDEFVLEIKKREILDSKDYEEVARLCANLLQQNTIKDHLIKNCIGKIGALEARLIQLEIDNERPLWQSLFKKVFHQNQSRPED